MDGDEWKPANVRPGGAALAASASAMALAAGPPRTLGHSSVLQCWLTGGKTYYMTPLSLGGYKAGGGLSGSVVLEIHYPSTSASGTALGVEVVTQAGGWLSRALLCRTLSVGKPMEWRGGGAGLAAAHCVSHDDGAGALVAAVNTHPTDSFELGVGVGAAGASATTTTSIVLGRGEGEKCVDAIPPLHAQLIQVVSPYPGVETWGYNFSFSVKSPAGVRESHTPPASHLFQVIPLVQ